MPIETIFMDPQNRRHSPRTDFKSIVDLVSGGRLYKEMSENISDTGIFLKSKQPGNYNIFDTVTLSFQLPDSSPVKYAGTVVRKTEDGLGVLFSGKDYPSVYKSSPRIYNLFEPQHIS